MKSTHVRVKGLGLILVELKGTAESGRHCYKFGLLVEVKGTGWKGGCQMIVISTCTTMLPSQYIPSLYFKYFLDALASLESMLMVNDTIYDGQ